MQQVKDNMFANILASISKLLDDDLLDMVAGTMAKMLEAFDKRLDTPAGTTKEFFRHRSRRYRGYSDEALVSRDVQHGKDTDTIQELLRSTCRPHSPTRRRSGPRLRLEQQ